MISSPDALLRRLSLPTGPVRAVLDTDTYNEVDDQFALVWALLSPASMTLEAVYAAPYFNKRSTGPGNGMELSYEEIGRILALAGKAGQVPNFRGATEYVGDEKLPRPSAASADLIARARTADPEAPLYVLAIAAITNVASAILEAPDIVDKIVVVWLGGHALDWPHTREFNLYQDVGAAQIIFDSGVALVLVPCLGVTTHLSCSLAELDRDCLPTGDLGRFLTDRVREYQVDAPGTSKVIWDLAAIAYLVRPEALVTTVLPAPILNVEGTWSADGGRHPIRYVRYIERDLIFGDLFQKLRTADDIGGPT